MSVQNETAPPNGMVQMKVTLTEPSPITTGSGKAWFDSAVFSDINGIALFSPNGDVSGAAVVRNGKMHLRLASPGGTFGTSLDYPILVTAVRVRPDAVPGQRSMLTLDPSSWMTGLQGQVYPQEIKPGTFTVAGSVSITDVSPGGATLPPDSTVSIYGVGFTPRSTVRMKNLHVLETRFISSTQIDVVIHEGVRMHGQSVQVTNPDGSTSLYYSYLRATALGATARPLLGATVPVFSSNTYTAADFLLPAHSATAFSGLSIQNPGESAANVAISLRDSSGAKLAQADITIPPGSKMTRECTEWISGMAATSDTFWHVEANQPIQMLGLFGDDGTGVVLPVNPFRTKP